MLCRSNHTVSLSPGVLSSVFTNVVLPRPLSPTTSTCSSYHSNSLLNKLQQQPADAAAGLQSGHTATIHGWQAIAALKA